jgi:hypothetical protein
VNAGSPVITQNLAQLCATGGKTRIGRAAAGATGLAILKEAKERRPS